MIEFFLADFNTGFAIALGLVISLALLEGIGMLIGLSLMSLLDQISPIDLDFEVDSDISDIGITPLLGWLCLNRLPLLIWLVLFLSAFAISGYSITFFIINNAIEIPSALMIYTIAFAIAILITRYLGIPLARLLPKNETSAVSNNSFTGLIAKITVGTAKINSPAEAALVDKFNQKHYVLVCPDSDNEIFNQGDEIVLVEKKQNVWLAIKFIQ